VKFEHACTLRIASAEADIKATSLDAQNRSRRTPFHQASI